jgi:hypothetical protein
MTKVYLYPQKIFKYFSTLVILFGVISCASSQTTTAESGETDGVYYSPEKDGQIEYAVEDTNDYDINVGNPYFDAEGNGAEDFYYEESEDNNQDINIYNDYGYNDIYLTNGASTDWGRYDGVDVTINNWGWNDPWGWNGFYGWGWSWGWHNYYYGYPGWNSWYSPYYGGYYGYNPYWNYYNPYYYNPYWGYGYGGGYYGYYGYPGYYYRTYPVRAGVRPGSNLAYSHNPGLRGNYRTPVRRTDAGLRTNVRNDGNVREENIRQVREVRPTTNVRNNDAPVRTNSTPNVRESNPDVRESNPNVRENVRPVRPVRATAPQGVRPNTPTRTPDNNVRTNSNNSPRTNVQTNNPPRNSNPRNNSGVRTSSPTRSSGGTHTSPVPSRSSGSSGGGVRRR